MTEEYSGHPGDLSEQETLARLTIEEKRAIAQDAIAEFPHLDDTMVNEWAQSYDCDILVNQGLMSKVESLVGCLVDEVESGEEPEALDRFIYGYMYPANLRNHGIDPDEVAERDPLGVWNGVY